MANSKVEVVHKGAPFFGGYLITYIGAAVYFVQNATGFFGVIGGLIKALFWPGFLIHRVFELLHI